MLWYMGKLSGFSEGWIQRPTDRQNSLNTLNPLFGWKQSVAQLGLIPSAAWLETQIWASPTSWWKTRILKRMISPQWLQAKKHSRTALSHGVPVPGSRTTKLCPCVTQAVCSCVAVLLWLVLFRINMKGMFEIVGNLLPEYSLHLRLIESDETMDTMMTHRLSTAWFSSAERHEVMHWTIFKLGTVTSGNL